MANFSQDVVIKARELDRESVALKTRVHHLAKSSGLTSKKTIEALGHAGIVVKFAASTINQNQFDAVLNLIGDHPEDASFNGGFAATKPTSEKPATKEKQPAGKPNAANEKLDEQAAAKSEKKPAAKKNSKKSAAKKATKEAAPKTEKKADWKAAKSEAKSDVTPAEEVTEKKGIKKASSSVVEEAVGAVVQSSPKKAADKKAADKNASDTVANTVTKTAEKISAEAPAVKSATVTTRRGHRVRRMVRTTSAPATEEAQGA